MMVVDRIRACQGQPSMVEAFMAEKGVYPMRVMTGNNGKPVMYDPNRQTSYPIMKRYPRYLKMISKIENGSGFEK
jgi:hypothetical protein